MPRLLIVYYSRTGRSHSVAMALADRLGAAIEAIDPKGAYTAFGSYFSGILAAWSGEVTPIVSPKYDPSTYELVVLVGPLWAGGISCPMRGYLAETGSRIGRYAAFITSTEGKPDRAFRELAGIVGREAAATGAVAVRDLLAGNWDAKVEAFAERIESVLEESA